MAPFASYPYQEYRLYVVFHKGMGRNNACLVKPTGERTTMSYARYLMSVHLKRVLTKNEHVDHVNNNKADDRIENFQLLTQKENNRKSAKPVTFFDYVCPVCQIAFKLTAQRKKANPTCSRKCGGIKSARTKRGE